MVTFERVRCFAFLTPARNQRDYWELLSHGELPGLQMIQIEQDLPDNCFAACVASILELPINKVPNFVGLHGHRWFRELIEWLRPLGLGVIFVSHSSCNEAPAGYSILSVTSLRGDFNHAVVALDGSVVWDPSPSREMGFGDKQYWVVFTLLDASVLQRFIGHQ